MVFVASRRRRPLRKWAVGTELPEIKLTEPEELLAQAFLDAVAWLADEQLPPDQANQLVVEALQAHDLTVVDQAVTYDQSTLEEDLEEAIYEEMTSEGEAEADKQRRKERRTKEPTDPRAPRPPRQAEVGWTFEANDPRAVSWARSQAASRVVEMNEDTRTIVRQVIRDSFERQMTVDETARRLRQSIGLTSRWERAVQSTRDAVYRQAIKNDLTPAKAAEQADKAAARHRDRLVRARAKMIARTEIMTAQNNGRYLSWLQAREKGLVSPGIEKEWVAAPHLSRKGPPCHICLPMDGRRVRMDQPFPNGRLMPPAHPHCRCTAILIPPRVSSDPPETSWDQPIVGANDRIPGGRVEYGDWSTRARRVRRDNDLPDDQPVMVHWGVDDKLDNRGSGVVFNAAGREWMVEVTTTRAMTINDAMVEAEQDARYVALRRAIDDLNQFPLAKVALRHAKSIAILRADTTRPGTLGSAYEGAMTLFRRTPAASAIDVFTHEVGHNVDNALWDLGHGRISETGRWAAAAKRDQANVWARNLSQYPLVQVDPSYHGFALRLTRSQLEDFRAATGSFPYGLTGYGTVNAREDWAESVMLWLRDLANGGLGDIEQFGQKRRLRFAELWPARDAEIRNQLADLGKYAPPVRKAVMMSDVSDAPLPPGVARMETLWFDADGYRCTRSDADSGEVIYYDKHDREVGRDLIVLH